MSGDDENFLDASGIRHRGWTQTMQKRFLHYPDKHVSAGAWYGGGSKGVWAESKLEAIEERTEFQEEFAKSCSRRNESPEQIARWRSSQSPKSTQSPLLARLLVPRKATVAEDPTNLPVRRRRDPPPLPETLDRLRKLAAERPEDESAHLVYSDALLEVGDAQGALISEMCAGGRDVPETLAKRLLGRLWRHADFWTFERGFLRALGLRRTGARDLAKITGIPEWEGVTSLDISRGPSGRSLPVGEVVAMLTHPVMHTLRAVSGLDQPTFLALCGYPLALNRLDVLDNQMWRSPKLPEPLLRPKHLSLRLYSSASNVNAWLWGAGQSILSELESIHVECFHDEDVAWLAVEDLPQLVRVSNKVATATREEGGWTATFDPCKGLRANDAIREALSGLPRELERFSPHVAKFVLRLPRVRDAWLDPIRRATSSVPTVYEHPPAVATKRAKKNRR